MHNSEMIYTDVSLESGCLRLSSGGKVFDHHIYSTKIQNWEYRLYRDGLAEGTLGLLNFAELINSGGELSIDSPEFEYKL